MILQHASQDGIAAGFTRWYCSAPKSPVVLQSISLEFPEDYSENSTAVGVVEHRQYSVCFSYLANVNSELELICRMKEKWI